MKDSLKLKTTGETQKDTVSLETFRLLYPIFKEEVYRRRLVMGQITRFGALFFFLLSVITVFFVSSNAITEFAKWSLVIGTLISSSLMVFQLIQEKSRHEQAKLQLIALEEGLKFFDSGTYFSDRSLYPDQWKKRPKKDIGLLVCITCLCGTAFLFILILFSV